MMCKHGVFNALIHNVVTSQVAATGAVAGNAARRWSKAAAAALLRMHKLLAK